MYMWTVSTQQCYSSEVDRIYRWNIIRKYLLLPPLALAGPLGAGLAQAVRWLTRRSTRTHAERASRGGPLP